MSRMDNRDEIIARLRKDIKERDFDIQKAATFGNQLLEDKEKLSDRLHQLLSENDALKQEKYSLQLDLEAKVQTVSTQASELEIRNEQFDKIKMKLEFLQKDSNSQKHQISNLTHENGDLKKILEEANQEKSELKKRNCIQQHQIRDLQQKAENSLNISLPQNLVEENDVNYYKLKNAELQEALSEIQFELRAAKLEESRLSNLVQSLEESVLDRDKEIKSFSLEIKKSRDEANELQCEIETLKLEQLDVNRRGNSVFGELDDRRKLVEKEYKLLVKKYDNMLKNYESNQQELSNCKGQMAILLSMTSRNYQTTYIQKLEDNLMAKKLEVESLNMKLSQFVKTQNQKQSCLEQLPKGGDQYAYLRVLYEQSEKKVKNLENDVLTLHMKNMNDNNTLTATQQRLYHCQEDLDAMKIENMKLQQQLKELVSKPDDPEPAKTRTRIEILPGYGVTPETIESVKSKLLKKSTVDNDIIPGELLLVDGEFREVKPPRRTNKSILRSMNRLQEEESPMPESDELTAEVKYLEDNSVKKHNENVDRPSYARYNLSAVKKKNNNDNCTHQ